MATSSIRLAPIVHWKGQWQLGVSYKKNAIVYNNGSAFICTTAGTSTEPNATFSNGVWTASTGWAVIAIGTANEIATLVMTLNGNMSVIAHAFATVMNRIEAIESKISDGFGKIIVEDLEVRHSIDDFSTAGNANLRGEGAPSVIPTKIGQRYLDITHGVWYTATGNTAVSNWKQDSNA